MNTWQPFVAEILKDRANELSEWEEEFCASFVERRWPSPTAKQRDVFVKIAEKLHLQLPDTEDNSYFGEDPNRPF